MSSSSGSTPRHPKRKATRASYNVDQQPSDVDMSEGERETTRAKRRRRGVNKGKGKGKSARAEQSEDEESDSDSDAGSKRKSTKARKTTKGKGKKGARRADDKLTSLPIELLTEICSHVTPGDLFSLMRTSRGLRSLINDSDSLWKKSRVSAGLPDLSANDITEKQYAQLVYQTQCQMCDRGKVSLADFFIRKSLCKACRKQHWVRLNWKFDQKNPHLHSLATTLVLTTKHSAASAEWSRYWSRRVFAFLPDLEAISDKLHELEGRPPPAAGPATVEAMDEDSEDEEDKLLREIMEDNEANSSAFKSTRTRQTRRPSTFGSASAVNRSSSPIGDEDDEEQTSDEESDEDEEQEVEGQLVQKQRAASELPESADSDDSPDREGALAKFIADRKALKIQAEADGAAMFRAAQAIARAQKEEKVAKSEKKKELAGERRESIETRILAEGEYSEADFTGAWYTSKIVNSAEPITDENWDTIKPKVIKLLARIKKDEAKIEIVSDQQARQESLRERYNKLRSADSGAVDDWLPLFSDFLHLDSVRSLWEPEDAKPEDDDVWAEHFDAVLEELDDYRISVRLRAVQMILAATTDVDEKELDNDADSFGPEVYYDEWFDFPTSHLVCSIPGCRPSTFSRYSARRNGNWTTETVTFFGSLAELLKHQHEVHPNYAVGIRERKSRNEKNVVGHFYLPGAVVSAMSAVIELGGLDDDSATTDDLLGVTRGNDPGRSMYRISRIDAYLEWEDSSSSKRRFPTYVDLRISAA